MDDAKADLTRGRKLAVIAAGNDVAVQQARTARAQAVVTAPRDGTVTSIAHVGDVVAPGATVADVVLKAAYGSLTLEEVIAFFGRKRVAKYKYPEHLVVVDSLPRNASGKIQKFLLRQDIIQRLGEEVAHC